MLDDYFFQLEQQYGTMPVPEGKKKPELSSLDHERIIRKICVSEDVSSTMLRWLTKMEFEKRIEIRSNRPGFRCFVDLTLANPVARSEWRKLLDDQYRVGTDKSDDLTAAGRRLGAQRWDRDREEERPTSRPWSL